jgi:glycosyltransferase involved in cell wall biosynthesis
VVIPNGVPDVPPALRADPRREPPRLTMVARFEPQKDHAGLLRALARLSRLPWTADLVGDGPGQAEARSLARALGLQDRVTFLGARTDVPELLADAQLAVLTTRWESLPLAVLEAMRAGLPVLASEVGGVGEAVTHGRNGLLVAPGDDVGLVAALRALLTDAELRARLGEAGRRRYLGAFTHARMLDQVETLYRRTAGHPPPPRPAPAAAQMEKGRV